MSTDFHKNLDFFTDTIQKTEPQNTNERTLTVAEAESKISCGEMNKDYTKLTNLYIITLISMKNK
jgi:hypothetical protein